MQKVIVLPRDDLQTEELILEEVEVFKVNFLLPFQSLIFFFFLSWLSLFVSFLFILLYEPACSNFFLTHTRV